MRSVIEGRFESLAHVNSAMNTRIPYKVFQIVLIVGIVKWVPGLSQG